MRGIFVLGSLETEYFQAFLELITKAPILSFPNFTLAFYMATDASNIGIAAVLYQSPNGEFVPGQTKYIAFQSRALHDHEKNYPVYKKKLLAVIFALRYFHYYLMGREFTLFTDHKSLTFLTSQKSFSNQILVK